MSGAVKMLSGNKLEMLSTRHERLNALAKTVSASKYLEIGVAHGTTFHQVDIGYKVAVDPKFQFEVEDYKKPDTFFYEVTSDEFFSKVAPEHGKFDLIFLDGLHTFNQTFRDFCASLHYAHENTIWLIDDTYPSSKFAAHPNFKAARRLRKLARSKDKAWMGDVFKVVCAIHDFFPQFSYATFPDDSQTAVWLETRKNFAPAWSTLERISRLHYKDFVQFKNSHMAIMESSKIVETITKSWSNNQP